MEKATYIIPISPITKKNSQQILTNRRTGKPFIAVSKAYRQYERDAANFIKCPLKPIDYPVNVECVFYMPTHRKVDLNNLLEAATDLLVCCGVLADDNSSIVESHDGSRVRYDPVNPRTEIIISSR